MATLKGIAYRNKKKAEMMETSAVQVTPERGVEGCYRGKPGIRQVTVMSMEDWQRACADINEELHWTTRRANLLVEDIGFSAASVGDVIQIGDLRLEITRETDPCSRMEQARKGLMKALAPDWRGGACCRVLAGGEIKVGDPVEIIKR
ncbi:MAG: molybdenum cofactor biosysynthesis protein [Gammaproteobacteria bacterium]|nr:MAG: molybdenum cofactor biosysynthesis protein [Gammaproteobacteria bacterium]RLA51871.1 MAG: molybdenum cofactor biosysynthesis protein [Gammaproteobacteria bacterium]